jgi:hypothetical protein
MAILECVYEVGENGLALQAASDEAETVDPAKAISALAQSRLGAPTGGGRGMSDAEKYWAHEAECLRHAERAVDNGLRRKLEALAQRWRQLAERAASVSRRAK